MNRRTIFIIAGALVFLCICSFAVLVAVGFLAEREQQQFAEFEPLKSICHSAEDNAGSPDATLYDPASALSPIIVLHQEDDDFSYRNGRYADTWRPDSLAAAQLVACVSEEQTETLQTCDYFDTDLSGNLVCEASYVERRQYSRTELLYSANGGKLIAKENLAGTVPDPCGDEVFFDEDGEIIYEDGTAVSDDDVANWLLSFFE